jgi:sortase A
MGVLLLGAGGVMAFLNSAAVVEPPPPVGVVEPLPRLSAEGNPVPISSDIEAPVGEVEPGSLPGLEQNPLPVFTEWDLSESDMAFLEISGIDDAAGQGEVLDSLGQAMREAEPDVPGGSPVTGSQASVPADANPPTRIVAPAIDLDSEVVPVGWGLAVQQGKPVSVWEVAEYAAGWHKNSALPGAGGNIVLSGHHNTKGEVFRYIADLDPDDTITLYVDDQPYTYTVESRFVVRDKGVSEEKRNENGRWIAAFPDERLTLVTCWPYTNNTHRVIVVAKPTS